MPALSPCRSRCAIMPEIARTGSGSFRAEELCRDRLEIRCHGGKQLGEKDKRGGDHGDDQDRPQLTAAPAERERDEPEGTDPAGRRYAREDGAAQFLLGEQRSRAETQGDELSSDEELLSVRDRELTERMFFDLASTRIEEEPPAVGAQARPPGSRRTDQQHQRRQSRCGDYDGEEYHLR